MGALHMFPSQVLARGTVTVLGVLGFWAWCRLMMHELSRMLSEAPGDKVRIARSLATTSIVSATALAVLAALSTPAEVAEALFYGSGSAVGATVPFLLVAWLTASHQYSGPATAWEGIGPSRRWIVAGVIASLVFVFAFGRGIAPTGYSFRGVTVSPFLGGLF